MLTMVRDYILLATGCVSAGVVLTFFLLTVTQRLGINVVRESQWLLALPAVISLIINVGLLELYRKYRERKGKEKGG